MNLKDDKNWKAVHCITRTVLSTDSHLYPESSWEWLVNAVEVEPIEGKPGHYKVVDN